jgi:dipeptidyl-peptidase-4
MDEWNMTVDLRAQYLVREGFAVLRVDNRGAAGRGLAFEAPLHRSMGTVEVADQATAVRELASRGLIDINRVGIYGWSYGGYMTVMCMLREPGLFKVGVAGAPVADWDGYDTGYTERYMETPATNPDGYREGSALTHAGALQGKLLLVHGGVDENVHFRHTARLVTALTNAGKDYDLLIFPEERHMPRDAKGMEYQERRLVEYFKQHL